MAGEESFPKPEKGYYISDHDNHMVLLSEAWVWNQ